jgi:hypothetical protein
VAVGRNFHLKALVVPNNSSNLGEGHSLHWHLTYDYLPATYTPLTNKMAGAYHTTRPNE